LLKIPQLRKGTGSETYCSVPLRSCGIFNYLQNYYRESS